MKAKTNRRHRNIGIVRHAKLLGVSTVHLSLVIKGERKSDGLLRRYRALIAGEKAAQPERALVESTLTRAAELRESFDESDPASEVNRTIAAELEALISPEVIAAVSKPGSRLTVSNILRFSEIFPPHLYDKLFGIRRVPGNPRHIIIGEPASQ